MNALNTSLLLSFHQTVNGLAPSYFFSLITDQSSVVIGQGHLAIIHCCCIYTILLIYVVIVAFTILV